MEAIDCSALLKFVLCGLSCVFTAGKSSARAHAALSCFEGFQIGTGGSAGHLQQGAEVTFISTCAPLAVDPVCINMLSID